MIALSEQAGLRLLRPTMRQAIAHLPLEEPICVCDECLMAFWKKLAYLRCASLCDVNHFEPSKPSPILVGTLHVGSSHDDGLVGNPVGNDCLHPVVHPDCVPERVEWAILIADLLSK